MLAMLNLLRESIIQNLKNSRMAGGINMNSNEILDLEVQKGIEKRFPNGMDVEHEARLKYELPIIKDMGYADYHLVVKDFLEYGRLLGYVPKNRLNEAPLTIKGLEAFIRENGWKNQGMMIGPGRGSAVGSLVCYLLGITNLDPLKYDLLFERFLNPERISMPDIDSDIANTTRSKVIEYVQNKYGENAVCGIMTTNAQAPKGSINIAAKFYGLKVYNNPLTSLGRTIAKDIPSDVGVSFNSNVDNNGAVDKEGEKTLYEFLLKKYEDNKDALEVIRWAKVVEGSFTAYGSHAAGIVISDNDDVSEYLPLRYNTRAGMFTTQCDMVQVEDNGLLKFDFLGLKTLDIITETLKMIEENHGVIIDPLNIDLADEKTYREILATGKTNSVFQFESNGMKNMLKRFKPGCFEDLIILVSMFRPGPLQYLDGVIDVKNGKKPMEFMCPELEPILGKTYGAIVYQEQVMQICQSLAGFTLGHADSVRRFMSKKKADKLAHEREAFVEGCKNNTISEDIANALFDQMMDFASYAFNKSHAAAYAFNAYITAWLKCHYPAEFFASALNWADNKKIAGLVYEAKKCNVNVLAPDVNLSSKQFNVVNGDIRFGLSSVAGVKDNADIIISERENGSYQSLKDFILRVRPDKTVITNLISAGALDGFAKNRKAMKEAADELREIMPKRDKKLSFVRSAEKVLPIIEKASAEEIIAMQKEAGFKVEISESTTAEKLSKKIETAKMALVSLDKDIESVRLHNITEDKNERMSLEKKFLGMYVTEHPMDFYPEAKEVNADMVNEIGEGNGTIYGVITDLVIKNRKSDGAKMAFFNIEDRSGSVEVAMFTRAYAKCEDKIKEGLVVKLTGNCTIEEKEDEEFEIKFFADNAEVISEKKASIMLPVSSMQEFAEKIEQSFKDSYEDANGYKLLIYDESMDQIVEMKYKVSEKVLTFPKATEVF
jgi:DNA polymerase-3 subunit alpha